MVIFRVIRRDSVEVELRLDILKPLGRIMLPKLRELDCSCIHRGHNDGSCDVNVMLKSRNHRVTAVEV